MTTSRVVWFFLNFILFPLWLLGEQDNNSTNPNGYFRAICFEKKQSLSLFYYPWNNKEEENATCIEWPISGSKLSPKICYYGKSPIHLYAISKGKPNEGKKLIYQHHFEGALNVPTEQLLLLAGDKIISYNFSESSLPTGSYSFHSFSKEPLYLKIGDEKFSLNCYDQKMVSPDSKSNIDRLPISIYRRRGQSYDICYDKKIYNFSKMRGIFLLKLKNQQINPFIILDHPTKKTKLLGYNTSPISKN